jgi:peptidoglycan glycosyltransferase
MPTPFITQGARTPDPDKVRTLAKVLLSAFLLVGVALIYWGVARAPAILARGDNPRLIETALRIQRGALLDRSGAVLAHNSGPADEQQRLYPANGGHGVGFYSLRYGTAGAEAAFASHLNGATERFWATLQRDLDHQPAVGEDVRLTLDLDLQQTAVAALNGHDGAILLLEVPHDKDGRAAVRVLASSPGYDANRLDEQFDDLAVDDRAPLLNRVTQGQYQPGLLLQPLILAAAVDQGIVQLSDSVADPNRPLQINGTTLRCLTPPPQPATWADVLRLRCPAPMHDLGLQLGADGLGAAFDAFGLDRDPAFELDVATSAEEPLRDPALAAIGQENLSVTPMQIGLAMAALIDGVLPTPQIGEAIITRDGSERPWHLAAEPSQSVSAAAARAVQQALPVVEDITEFSPLVLSGPEGSTNAWYTGHWAGSEADYIAVIVLENSVEQTTAQAAGRSLLRAAQAAEK